VGSSWLDPARGPRPGPTRPPLPPGGGMSFNGSMFVGRQGPQRIFSLRPTVHPTPVCSTTGPSPSGSPVSHTPSPSPLSASASMNSASDHNAKPHSNMGYIDVCLTSRGSCLVLPCKCSSGKLLGDPGSLKLPPPQIFQGPMSHCCPTNFLFVKFRNI